MATPLESRLSNCLLAAKLETALRTISAKNALFMVYLPYDPVILGLLGSFTARGLFLGEPSLLAGADIGYLGGGDWYGGRSLGRRNPDFNAVVSHVPRRGNCRFGGNRPSARSVSRPASCRRTRLACCLPPTLFRF